MLSQLWLFVIGFLFCNLYQRTFDPVLRTLLALPLGWAIFGVCATVVYGTYFSTASQMLFLVVLALTMLALLVANVWQRALSRNSILLGSLGLLLVAAACCLVNELGLVTMTPDSSYLARFGQNIGLGNYEGSQKVFSMWGPFVPFIHSMTNLLGQKLYWQYQAVLSLHLVVIVFYTVYTTIREQKSMARSWVAAIVLVSLMAFSNIFLFHVSYIHVNIISALYLYLFVFALLKMPQQSETAYDLLALLSLIAFSLLRVEAPLFVIVILLITSFWPGWSYAHRLKLTIPFVALFVAWYARVYFLLPESSDLLTPKLAIVMIAALIGFGLFAVVSNLKILAPVVLRTPFITLSVLALLGLILTAMEANRMLTSLGSMLRNLFITGDWGLTWYLIVILVIEVYFACRSGVGYDCLSMVLVGYVLLVYNLAYVTTNPYRLGASDSANRLVLQALPLVILYLSKVRFAHF